MGVFDQVIIVDSSSNTIASIQRSGPLEGGTIAPNGSWLPTGGRTVVDVEGFGIDAQGYAYFNSAGAATPGQEAALCIDGSSGNVWVEQ